MKQLAVFDDGDYAPDWAREERTAVRAIILRGGRVAMVKSRKEGFYKFPGGGIEQNETHMQALCRETLEEAGLKIVPGSVREMGEMREIRKSLLHENEIFDHVSRYYFADVEAVVEAQNLDPYEAELAYALEWVAIETAYRVNMALGTGYRSKFILREAFVLKLLMDGH